MILLTCPCHVETRKYLFLFTQTPFSFCKGIKLHWTNVIKTRCFFLLFCFYGILHRGEIPERFATLAWKDRPPNNFPFSFSFFFFICLFVCLSVCLFVIFWKRKFPLNWRLLTLASDNDRLNILTCIQESSSRRFPDKKLDLKKIEPEPHHFSNQYNRCVWVNFYI